MCNVYSCDQFRTFHIYIYINVGRKVFVSIHSCNFMQKHRCNQCVIGAVAVVKILQQTKQYTKNENLMKKRAYTRIHIKHHLLVVRWMQECNCYVLCYCALFEPNNHNFNRMFYIFLFFSLFEFHFI